MQNIVVRGIELDCELLHASQPSVAIICDLAEENWPSMDFVADMLFTHLHAQHTGTLRVTNMRPMMRRRFSHLPLFGRRRVAYNADRLLNRLFDYPRLAEREKQEFDLFHVIDHSYSQIVRKLPASRTVITCHDLDTFRCLLDPQQEPRSRPFRAMVKHILEGFCRAARIICVSSEIREQVLRHGLVPPGRVTVIPLGFHPTCSPFSDTESDEQAKQLLGAAADDAPLLLHVGATIERKRIDVLLNVFASIRKKFPKARLIRVGGPLTSAQTDLLGRLRLSDAVIELPFLKREVLAAIYRRADLVLQPSEREGFGLPVLETMACGTVVVASDLPVLREVGGAAAVYCPVADVPAWTESVISLLTERTQVPDRWDSRRVAGLNQAAKFSWTEHTKKVVDIYRELLT